MDDPEDGDDFDDIQDFDDTDDQQAPPEDQDDGDDQQAPPEDQDDGDDQPPARRPSRAEARIQVLDREAREQRERADAAERRLNEVLNGSSRADADRQERERLAQMLPEERAEYIARKTKSDITSEISSLRGQIADSTDRAEFATACATNPALAKVKDKVEAELVKLRASGSNVPRGTLAAFLIGQSVLEKAPKARERAARRGAANLDRERARPAGGASDAPRGRELSEKAARDKRLQDFTF